LRLRRKYDPFEKVAILERTTGKKNARAVAILERTTGKKNARALILLPSRLPEGAENPLPGRVVGHRKMIETTSRLPEGAENPLPGRVVGHRKMIETTKVKLWSYVISCRVVTQSAVGSSRNDRVRDLPCEANDDCRVWSLRCSG
jgi:hypothetical protein